MQDEIVGKSAIKVCFGILLVTFIAMANTGCSNRGYEFKIGLAPITTQDNRSGFEAPDLKRVRANRGAIVNDDL